MAQWLTVWRAAQLVGLPRGVLQQQVRDGRLALADGLVSVDALRALYPQAPLEDAGALEQVSRIKDEAFGRRVRERMLPSQDVLAQRLFHQTRELADVRLHLQRYHALVLDLQGRLREAAAVADSPAERERLEALQRELQAGLARALATESVDTLEVVDDMLKVMSAQVTLRPSGHEFTVEGHDTLLQAGLRAGLKLPYGCGNGTCGLCKVRVVAGEVAKVMPFDYPLSEAEKRQGCTLMCAHTAASAELTLETLEAAGPQDIPVQQLVAQVRAVQVLAPDTRLLHLQTPRSHRLRFLAGQSVELGLHRHGQDLHRALPVASCPCDDRNLHFFVARDPADPLASLLFDGGLKPGDSVTVCGPMGDFVLRDGARPLVFAACDTGFAPARSLIEHAMALEEAPTISLYWGTTRADGPFMGNLCRAWSEALDHFEYAPLAAADAASAAVQVAEAMREDLFGAACDYYVAGPQAFVDALDAALADAGVPASQRSSLVVE